MPIDVHYDGDGDLDLTGGDISFGESTAQHERDIIVAHKGDYRLSPGTGVGIIDFLESSGENVVLAISQQLAADGMTVNSVQIVNGNYEIDANY
jgi:hypothetical protein